MSQTIAHVPAKVFATRFNRLYRDRRCWSDYPYRFRLPFDRAFYQTAFDYAKQRWCTAYASDSWMIFKAVKRWSIRNPEKAAELFEAAEEYGSLRYRAMKLGAAIRTTKGYDVDYCLECIDRETKGAERLREKIDPILSEVFSENANVADPHSLIVRFYFLCVRSRFYQSEMFEERRDLEKRW